MTFPWTPGLPQARCRTCRPRKCKDGVMRRPLCVAMTLVDGVCAQCRRYPPKEVAPAEPVDERPAQEALFDA